MTKENVIQIKSGITINADVSVKNIIYAKTIIFGILLHVAVKHLASIIDDSVIMFDEIMEETKTAPTYFNKKI